ncbi:MAG: ExbD/TolR family protein [Desulfovibrio sp.]
MIVHFHKRSRYKITTPLTSIVDIVFLLLIYFLLTTNYMVDEGINVRLPKAQASTPQVQRELVVYIDGTGQTWVDKDPVAENKVYAEVKKRLAGLQNKSVIIRADKELVLDKAVRVMDMVKAAGAAKLCLATEKNGAQR